MSDDGRFLGRERELAALSAHIGAALAGDGSAVFIDGEAGVGKTTLVERALAGREGVLLAKGWCVPDSGAPLLPFQEALRSIGLEHLLSWSAPPRLESVFLVTKDGIPVARRERAETGLDPDIFSSMLSAVSNFVKDSMSLYEGGASGGSLSGLEYGKYKVVIDAAASFSIVGLITGRDDELLRRDLRALLDSIEAAYGPRLAGWDGDLELFRGAEAQLADLIGSGRYDGVDHIRTDAEMKRAKIFESVVEGLRRRSQERAVVLFLDDIQWADESSLALVHHLSRNLRGSRAVLLATYRSEEAPDGSPLRSMMRVLSREGLSKELSLGRLERDPALALISRLCGERGVAGKVRPDDLFELTKGNPFFIVETVDFVAKYGPGELPPKVMDLVMCRVERLERTARDYVELASVYGLEFDQRLVAGILGLSRLDAIKLERGLQSAERLVVATPKCMAFEHKGFREAIYRSLPEATRRDYHLLIAETLEGGEAKDPFLLARHFHAAGSEKGLPYMLAAGDASRDQFANSEAYRFYRMAVSLAPPGSGMRAEGALRAMAVKEVMGDLEGVVTEAVEAMPSLSGQALGRALTAKGAVEARMGRNADAAASFSKARELLPESDPHHRALLGAMGAFEYRHGDFASAEAHLARRLELTPPDDAAGTAEAFRGLAALEYYRGNADRASESWERAYAAFEGLGEVRKAAQVANNLGVLAKERGDFEAALRWARSSMAIFSKMGDMKGMAAGHNNMYAILRNLCRFSEASGQLDRAEALFRSLGEVRGVAEVRVNRGVLEFTLGRCREAVGMHGVAAESYAALGDDAGLARALVNRDEALSCIPDAQGQMANLARMDMLLPRVKDRQFALGIAMAKAVSRLLAGDAEGCLADLSAEGGPLAKPTGAESHARAMALRAAACARLGRRGDADAALAGMFALLREKGLKAAGLVGLRFVAALSPECLPGYAGADKGMFASWLQERTEVRPDDLPPGIRAS